MPGRHPGRGLQDAYFRDAGRRAAGPAVEFTGIEWAEFEID
ncbi:hypothetical protein [Kitasatospora sp. KL5]